MMLDAKRSKCFNGVRPQGGQYLGNRGVGRWMLTQIANVFLTQISKGIFLDSPVYTFLKFNGKVSWLYKKRALITSHSLLHLTMYPDLRDIFF